MFMYWTTTSIFSLGQVIILKVPRIRKWLHMPVIVKHPKPPPEQSLGFLDQLKKSEDLPSLLIMQLFVCIAVLVVHRLCHHGCHV